MFLSIVRSSADTPVSPGTQFVTLGGMVAADIHGKNHHLAGGFGNHIESLTLVQSDGQSITCSATENAELFRATIGGMGLTGIITTVTLRVMAVETPFIRQVLIAAPNLDALFRAFEESKDWTYTVAWTDCLAGGSARGRSIFFRGEHALVSEVDPARIGVMGHSYGGKWAMFASCFYEQFAAAAWSDPGIVFDEPRGNVNYWEPWYLGRDPQLTRKPGLIRPDSPRTGAYKTMMETGREG